MEPTPPAAAPQLSPSLPELCSCEQASREGLQAGPLTAAPGGTSLPDTSTPTTQTQGQRRLQSWVYCLPRQPAFRGPRCPFSLLLVTFKQS